MDSNLGKNIQNKGRTLSTLILTRTCHSAIALLFFFPAFIFSSCTHGTAREDAGTDSGSSSFGLHINTGRKTASEADGDHPVDIFIYNDDGLGRIDSYQRLCAGEDNMVAAASRKGKKIVVAVSNPQQDSYDWNSISSFETIGKMHADLRMEDPGSPLMSGVARIDAADNGRFEVTVQPVLSEIYIRSIRCDFSGRPYSSAVLKNASAYLSNVNSLAGIIPDGDLTPTAPLNTDGLPHDSYRSLEHPEMVYAEFEEDIGPAAVYPEIRLYCYPNSSEKDSAGTPFTRLVIAGDIDGKRYYYPININKGEFGAVEGAGGIGRNCRYVFDITIRQTGSADPTVPVSAETADISASVLPWDVAESEIGY